MKITIERTNFEPVYDKNGVSVSWNIAWDITTDTGMNLHAPASVSRTEMKNPPTEANVTVYSFTQVLPGQIYELYKDFDVLTELDLLAQQLAEETLYIEQQKEHNKRLKEDYDKKLAEAKAELEAKRKERAELEKEAAEI